MTPITDRLRDELVESLTRMADHAESTGDLCCLAREFHSIRDCREESVKVLREAAALVAALTPTPARTDEHDPLCSLGQRAGDQTMPCDCRASSLPAVPGPQEGCATRYGTGATLAFCELPAGHTQNHRGLFVNGAGSVQWPEVAVSESQGVPYNQRHAPLPGAAASSSADARGEGPTTRPQADAINRVGDQEIARAAVAYMAEHMAMPTPFEDQEQNWILSHITSFASQLRAASPAPAPALVVLNELEAQITRDMAPHGGLGSGTLTPTLDRLRRAISAQAAPDNALAVKLAELLAAHRDGQTGESCSDIDDPGSCSTCATLDSAIKALSGRAPAPAAGSAWQPMETAPKDRWVWMYSRRSRSQMVASFRWDESHDAWFAGTGWWPSINQFFTHWADITGPNPPPLPPPPSAGVVPSE